MIVQIVYFGSTPSCLITRNTITAVIKKSIMFARTFPYKTPLHESSSSLCTLSLVRSGLKISGVTKSSMMPFTRAQTLPAIRSPIAIPITLYFARKSINSAIILTKWWNKSTFSIQKPGQNTSQVSTFFRWSFWEVLLFLNLDDMLSHPKA